MSDRSPQDIFQQLQDQGVLSPDGIVVSCRLEFRQKVFLGVDDINLALVAVRPDTTLSVQTFPGESILKISPPSIQTGSPSFTIFVGEHVWHFDEVPRDRAETLETNLSWLTGRDLSGMLSNQGAGQSNDESAGPPSGPQNQEGTGSEAAAEVGAAAEAAALREATGGAHLEAGVSVADPEKDEPRGKDEAVPDEAPSSRANAAQESPASALPLPGNPVAEEETERGEGGSARGGAPGSEEREASAAGAREEAGYEEEEEEEDDDDTPWYATVKGPAKSTYFRERNKDVKSPGSAEEQAEAAQAEDEGVEEVVDDRETPKAGKPREVGSLNRLVVRWRKEMAKNLDSIKPYRELCRIYMQSGDVERAFWHAAVLTHFGVSEPVEKEFYESHRPRYPKYIGRYDDQSVWMAGVTPKELPTWPQRLFATLARALTLHMGKTLRSYGLKKKDRCDVEKEKLLLANIFSRLRDAMGYHSVDLFLSPESEFDVLVANVVEKKRWSPLLVAGKHILSGRTEEEITFLLARDMAYLRPEHITCLLLPDRVQQTFLMTAALKLVRPNLVEPGPVPERDRITKLLREELLPEEIQTLEELVEELVVDKVDVDLAEWARWTRLACNRAGLLFCQDLATAARLTAAAPIGAVNTEDTAARLRELVLYAISPQHFETRKQLRIPIEE